jgi:hypothetical protein
MPGTFVRRWAINPPVQDSPVANVRFAPESRSKTHFSIALFAVNHPILSRRWLQYHSPGGNGKHEAVKQQKTKMFVEGVFTFAPGSRY